jgi:hypothetical protein
LWAESNVAADTASVKAMRAPQSRAYKNPPAWRKPVPGLSPGGTQAKGEKTSGSEDENRLVAAGLPGLAVAGLAALSGLGGLPQCRGLPGVASASV